MPRGGRRPGAGAPRGNLNGVKTGAHSPRLRALYAALMLQPLFRQLVIHYTRRNAPRFHRAAMRRLYFKLLAQRIAAQALSIQSNTGHLSPHLFQESEPDQAPDPQNREQPNQTPDQNIQGVLEMLQDVAGIASRNLPGDLTAAPAILDEP